MSQPSPQTTYPNLAKLGVNWQSLLQILGPIMLQVLEALLGKVPPTPGPVMQAKPGCDPNTDPCCLMDTAIDHQVQALAACIKCRQAPQSATP